MVVIFKNPRNVEVGFISPRGGVRVYYVYPLLGEEGGYIRQKSHIVVGDHLQGNGKLTLSGPLNGENLVGCDPLEVFEVRAILRVENQTLAPLDNRFDLLAG